MNTSAWSKWFHRWQIDYMWFVDEYVMNKVDPHTLSSSKTAVSWSYWNGQSDYFNLLTIIGLPIPDDHESEIILKLCADAWEQ